MEREKYKLYKCYSDNQKKWLMGKGFRYEMVAKDPNTGVLFWVFMRTKEFNNMLDEYKPYVV